MFIALIIVMASRVHVYLYTHQIMYISCVQFSFVCINYTSVKLLKKSKVMEKKNLKCVMFKNAYNTLPTFAPKHL